VIVLDEAPNIPSVKILCRHIFEWTAHAAFSAENLATHIKQNQWKPIGRLTAPNSPRLSSNDAVG
jgi:hypothetical protein